VADERTLVNRLISAGNEVSVHGLDAWHSVEKGREERARIAETSGKSTSGVRMHWLCFDASSPRVLEQAGFHYDSTSGYNETVGYRAGTQQVFRPSTARKLLELPLHIQDTALFYPGRLGSQGNRAWTLCEDLIENASTYGGVLTMLWHTRSLAPERHWDEFYIRLLNKLKSRRVWFATAAEIVKWFRRRRAVSFKAADFSGDTIRLELEPRGNGGAAPNVVVRIHAGGVVHDISWKGKPVMNLSLAELGSF
jgi:peptidoglycan/xylan/chitin deacetylase (PgdA/CDA1 family)